ncbi:MAG: aminopeptidase P family protein [Pirellulaceae bacterium]|nr:aminopeptidase P family protein [Pirellulaceae bacterium]
MSGTSRRRDRLRQLLEAAGRSAMLVTHAPNVRYLTGFTGEDSYLLVTDQEELLISDGRFEEQLRQECPGLPSLIRQPGEPIAEVTCQQLRARRLSDLVVETSTMSVEVFDVLCQQSVAERVHKGGVQVESLRELKDADEIAILKRAIDVAQRAFLAVRKTLSTSHTERDVAAELEWTIRKLGGGGCSFEPIVAVGARAALPHARAGDANLGSGGLVLIDWGATVDGYRSDLTRVLWTSKIPPKFTAIYQTVLEAQQAAIAVIRPGIRASDVDRAARQVFEAAGINDRFSHGLGHGIGLEVHEAPRLNKNQERELEPGMVVTVEPGVYFPDLYGVRIEDDVLVTQSGCEVLSDLPTDLQSNLVTLSS